MTRTVGPPLWADCRRCGYRWLFAHIPVSLAAIGKAARAATCPSCGATTRLYLAPEGAIPRRLRADAEGV